MTERISKDYTDEVLTKVAENKHGNWSHFDQDLSQAILTLRARVRELETIKTNFTTSEWKEAAGRWHDKYNALREAAQDLYDNRLGWSDGRNPYAHPEFWDKLRDALNEGGGNVDGVNTSAGRVDETGSCKQVEGGTGKEPKE
jgi:hypothetical protein